MRIAVTGAGGLIGSAVTPLLAAAGHEVVPLVRRVPRPGERAVRWNPETGEIDAAGLEGFDAVIHLAGENISAGRWTAARKAAIRDSRVRGTALLCDVLASCARPPKTLISASAVGYYGDGGDAPLTEESPRGNGFLADVCAGWEAACAPALRKGIRVVNLRIGVVLALEGGALPKMLPLFRLGLGGPLGSGKQYMSWIAIDDLAAAFPHALAREDLKGPVNAVAPRPVTNREMAEALGSALSRPAVLPAPAFALRLAMGEMADELLLSGCRVVCRRLDETGFHFRFPEIGAALRHLLARQG